MEIMILRKRWDGWGGRGIKFAWWIKIKMV
jgi:hypothetical protein